MFNRLALPHRRRLTRAAAVCIVLSVSPMALVGGPAGAENPATIVVGLSPGSRGEAVLRLQEALINQGVVVTGGVDGVFGSGTQRAVKEFQRSVGLAESGVVDAATALALGLASSPLLGLTQGNRGDAVSALQQRLVDAGIELPGGVDGVFGASTAAALKNFQTKQGLATTGSVDAATAAALGSVSVSTSGPTTSPPLPPTASTTPSATPTGASASSTSDGSASAAAGSTSLVGLKVGARGSAVGELQRQLVAAGVSVRGGADGVFGMQTAAALSSFQKSVGLKPTAVVDEATADALASASSGGPGRTSTTPTTTPTTTTTVTPTTTSGNSGTSSGSSGAAGATSPLLGLKYGSRGEAVIRLQDTLIAAGIPVRGGADGVFGLGTQSSVKQYQQLAGLDITGKVDDATASALASGRSVTGTPSATLVGLKSGTLGSPVVSLQKALIAAGIAIRGGADGVFGPVTSAALKSFQTSQGLTASGIVDEATAAALKNPKPAGTASTGAGSGSGSTAAGYATYGEKGARVTELQNALILAGITLRGGVDGDFGAGTSAAVMDFQRAKGLPITGRIDDATATTLGLGRQEAPKPTQVATGSVALFPVQGQCFFSDTWHAARSGGRLHLGVDIIAPRGKLIYAVADGTISKVYTDYPGSLSGNGVRLTTGDGTYYFYAHMVSVADGITAGSKVKAGQIIGYVGSTGNAGTNHLHFEVHPQGGDAVNPYPLVKAVDACSVTAPLPQP